MSTVSKIKLALDEIRPFLLKDGGDIDLVSVGKDGVVKVKLLGNCESCPMSMSTLKACIEESVRKAVPEIKKVEAINI